MDGITGEPVVWRTDEPCPVCGTGLFIVGHRQPIQVAECRLCGWSETWDLTHDIEPDTSSDKGKRGDAR